MRIAFAASDFLGLRFAVPVGNEAAGEIFGAGKEEGSIMPFSCKMPLSHSNRGAYPPQEEVGSIWNFNIHCLPRLHPPTVMPLTCPF